MKKHIKKINMVIETEKSVLQFSLRSEHLRLDRDAHVDISNMQRAPYFALDGQPALLLAHETKLIEQLIEVCSYYGEKGDPNLSALVDKIGMTLMQSFLSRHASRHDRPRSNGALE
jgi:hypothetical protein